MTIVQHNIQRLQFDLHIDNEKRALKIQNEVSMLARNELPGIIENALGKVDKQEFVRIIDKIEIDLGEIQAVDFTADFVSKFITLLTEQLETFNWEEVSLPEGTEIHSVRPGSFNILRHFLLYGTLPWYLENQEIDLKLEMEEMLQSKNTEFLSFIDNNIHIQRIRKRLLYSFPQNIIHQLIQELAGEAYPEVEQLILLLPEIIKLLDIDGKKLSTQEIVFLNLNSVLLTIAKRKQFPSFSLREIYLQEISVALFSSSEEFDQAIRSVMNYKPGIDDKITGKEYVISAEIIAVLREMKGMLSRLKASGLTQEKEIAKQQKTDKEKFPGYYISNGGMVLLHPFLAQLFKKLKFIKDGEFVNKNTHHKAMHLLQYAVYGNENKPEYLMVLNKIICGYPVDEPVPWHVNLSSYEKAETTKMLKAVIKHWSALKNTSVKGLKTSFLQRNAILKQNEKSWKLSLERTAFDVLLDHIPWNYSLIKLSWMEKLIEVEW